MASITLDELFGMIQEDWGPRGLYHEKPLLDFLEDRAGIQARQEGEMMLVVGSREKGRRWEGDPVAKLYALSPGIVICICTDNARVQYNCSGFLERVNDSSYQVRSFASKASGTHATLLKTPTDGALKGVVPAIFFWEDERSQSQGSVGIDVDRWPSTETWLDKWLAPA